MVGGAIGVILTGVFASLAVNALGVAGGWTQLGRQTVLAAAGIAYPFVMTLLILWVTDKTVGLRVTPEEEDAGLDFSLHGEVSYEWPGDIAALAGPSSAGEPVRATYPLVAGDGGGGAVVR
jgi:Amt family ammonium transporter